MFISIYACKLDRGRGAPTGKFQMKVFCKDLLAAGTDPDSFSARIDKKMVVGTAIWKKEREVEQNGRPRILDPHLLVDCFCQTNITVVKRIIYEELVVEKVSVRIGLEEPKARTAMDQPPRTIELELKDGVEYEGTLFNLILSGDTCFMQDKLLLMGGEYDKDDDATVFTLSETNTKEFVTENLQSLCDLAGFTLKTVCSSTDPIHSMTSHRAPTPLPCATLSLAELISEEEDLLYHMQKQKQRQNMHAEEKQKLHACMIDIEMATGVPVLDVMTVLGAFAQMGASAGELKDELRMLLLDEPYWFGWCAQSNWYA